MEREALIVGIRYYSQVRIAGTESESLRDLPAAEEDATVIAELLGTYGGFRIIKRLPEPISQNRGRPSVRSLLSVVQATELETKIKELFNPSEKSPDTAFFYFAGHGWRDETGKCFLVTNDSDPSTNNYGVSLCWLQEQLDKSPVENQIVCLDCCFSGGLLDREDTYSDNQKKNRCLIVACRSYETTTEDEYGLLTGKLLQWLNPEQSAKGWVTSYDLKDLIDNDQSLTNQRAWCEPSGKAIILTSKLLSRKIDAYIQENGPYVALNYFRLEDAKLGLFYGRSKLTKNLIRLVHQHLFIAVLGASGSGKSSVLRAGLLYQLQQGQEIAGSDRWRYIEPFTPDADPFESLHKAISKAISHYCKGETHPSTAPCQEGEMEKAEIDLAQLFEGNWGDENRRVVMIIDQFEECFSLCRDDEKRQQFFDFLLEALARWDNHQFSLVIGMRSEFRGSLLGTPLGKNINLRFIAVGELNDDELGEAIVRPAEQAGFNVDLELKRKIIEDVIGEPDSLPLVQFTLTELWKKAKQQGSLVLTLDTYEQLGGIEGTLNTQASVVYDKLSEAEKPVARRIFLELIQLGEAIDMRRRIHLGKLVNSHHTEEQLKEVSEKLADKEARLITIKEDDKSPDLILDVVHEALIRKWEYLQNWKKDYRPVMELERKIEDEASNWREDERKTDLLLPESKLALVKENQSQLDKLGILDRLAEEYITASSEERDRRLKAEKERHQRLQGLTAFASIFALIAVGVGIFALHQKSSAECAEKVAKTGNYLSLNQTEEGLVRAIYAKDQCQFRFWETLVLEMSSLPGKIQRLPGEIQSLPEKIHASIQPLLQGKGLTSVQSSLLEAVQASRERKQLQEGGQVAAVSPDDKMIVTGGKDGRLQVWNLDDLDGKPIRSFVEDAQKTDGIANAVISVAFSRDGNHIVSGNRNGKVRLWSLKNKDKLTGRPLQIHQFGVTSVAFSPDSKLIVSSGWDGEVKLWNLDQKDSQNPKTFIDTKNKADKNVVFSVAFSDDGKFITSGGKSKDKPAKLWDLQGNLINSFKGNDETFRSVAFSPDEKYIVIGSQDGRLKLWDLKNNKYKTFIGHKDAVLTVAFSPDSQFIVSGSQDGTARVWSLQGNPKAQPFTRHEGVVSSVAFSRDGKFIVSASTNETVWIWDWENKLKAQPFPSSEHKEDGHKDNISSVAFSPDSQSIVSGSWDGTIKLWDLQGKVLKPFPGDNNQVTSVAFKRDGKFIVSGSEDGTLKMWDLKSDSKKPKTFTGHTKGVTSVAFSPDGKFIASGSKDGTLKMWDLKSDSKKPKTFAGHTKGVTSVALSPDGQHIVSGSEDGTVKLWNHDRKPIGKPFRERLQEHREDNSITSVAFSPGGQFILSGSKDGTVRLWTLEGKLIGQLFREEQDAVTSVAFSPDGQYIVSGSENGKVWLWDISEKTLLKKACPPMNSTLITPMHESLIKAETPEARNAGEICLTRGGWSKQEKARFLWERAKALAESEKVEGIKKVEAELKRAKNYDSSLAFDPETEAKRLVASVLVKEGGKLAQQKVDIQLVIDKFQEAKEYNLSLKFDPETEAKRLRDLDEKAKLEAKKDKVR